MEGMDEAVGGDGVKTGIAQDDIEPAGSGRVALDRGPEVGEDRLDETVSHWQSLRLRLRAARTGCLGGHVGSDAHPVACSNAATA